MRRGLVGPAKNMSTFIGLLMLAGMFMVIIVFVFNYFTDFGVMMQISSNQLNTIDFAYMAEDCFREEGEYYIRAETLDELQKEHEMDIMRLGATYESTSSFIRQYCGIFIEDGGIMVTNVETNKEWDFDYDGSDKYRHSIFVNIEEGDNIYVGQLDASINA